MSDTEVVQGINHTCLNCGMEGSSVCNVSMCHECTEAMRRRSERRAEFERVQTLIPPIISGEALDEVQLAIANSEERSCCICSKKDKAKRQYFESMKDWVDTVGDLSDQLNDGIPHDKNEASKCVRSATYISFCVNVCLLVAKVFALATSNSYTIISSVTDSALDLIAGIIISLTAANSKFTRADIVDYPVGKTRISTVGILVFSVLMSAAAFFIILQCILSLVAQEIPAKNSLATLIVMGVTVVTKLVMWIVYYITGHPLTRALSEDHRNDVFSNALGLFMYWGSENIAWWMDAAGGILLSCFILFSWISSAVENATMLVGHSAPPELLRLITYVASHHHPDIAGIEQVMAFQFGPAYFCELHIIVHDDISLTSAHWIGESLQLKIERIEGIERAWVHLDVGDHDNNEHILEMRASGRTFSSAPQTRQEQTPDPEPELAMTP